jgi:hypothetical protein
MNKLLTTNILKMEEIGIYVTSIDGRAFYSPMVGFNSPTLDKDGCIDWTPFENISEELDEVLSTYLESYRKKPKNKTWDTFIH